MNVRPGTRRRALLGIYRIRRKRKGGRLTGREIERAWTPTTGLRQSDLRLALADMVERQLLLAHDAPRGTIYELTYLGECAMRAPLGDPRDWITLLRARLRRPKSAAAGRRRTGETAAHAH